MKNRILKPDLRVVFWELTYGCNLKCIHCRAEAGPQRSPDELSTEEALELIHRIKEFANPIVVLTGGEPLVRPDIFEIAQAASRTSLRVALATNGTLIDDSVASRIVDSGIQRVSISLDGASSVTHDTFRGVPGSYDAAIRGFKALKKLGMELQINVTVAKHNLAELPQIMRNAEKMGAHAFHMFLLVPVGCGIQIAQNEEITPRQYEEVLRWFYEEMKNSRMEMKATCAPHFFRVRAQLDKEGKKKLRDPSAGHGGMSGMTRGCLAGSSVCFVSHRGDVYPCGYLPLKAGNVREQPFQQIWFDSPLFASLRDLSQLKGKCGACEYKFLCQGCRARAYGISGDYLNEEPFCVYEPARMKT
ncbi:MAG: radical SAM protein [Candidatus Eisenbacteria bacterium]|nr:radical SAM protein [Candidatus Eisenbacteria bacterium]